MAIPRESQTANNSPFDIASLEKGVLFFKCSKIKETLLKIILLHYPIVHRFEAVLIQVRDFLVYQSLDISSAVPITN
ncbi:hypothetical protein RIR_jg14853.t1 [Rhizophagus irregularis DAOM 181602=DAOM 197198]|nr:hypothetical protein RIR_jg14853.t1 [Rhizophagus irregularis DAOM 181602=DAOM 197198]